MPRKKSSKTSKKRSKSPTPPESRRPFLTANKQRFNLRLPNWVLDWWNRKVGHVMREEGLTQASVTMLMARVAKYDLDLTLVGLARYTSRNPHLATQPQELQPAESGAPG